MLDDEDELRITKCLFPVSIYNAAVGRGTSDKLGQSIACAHAAVTKKNGANHYVCLEPKKQILYTYSACLVYQTKYETKHMLYN